MKKLLLSLMILVSGVSYADDYKYLIVENKAGEQSTYVLSGLSIAMDGHVLTFRNTEVEGQTMAIADVEKMFFSENTAAINSVFRGQGGVAVYDLSGKLVGTFSSREKMESALGRGAFLIKSAEGTKKEVRR